MEMIIDNSIAIRGVLYLKIKENLCYVTKSSKPRTKRKV